MSLDISVQDYAFLIEFAEVFGGLSNVKKLALGFRYTFNTSDKRTWWGLPSEEAKNPKGGNQKTAAIYYLLQVTSKLTALEVMCTTSHSRPGDDTRVWSACLWSLDRSFGSLKHLRYFGIAYDPSKPSETTADLSVFKALRVLTLDHNPLLTLTHYPQALPSSLEIIYLPFYSIDASSSYRDFEEETLLAGILESRSLPKLKEVAVPSEATRCDGNLSESYDQRQMWPQKRKELKKVDDLMKGKVLLREVASGEVGEFLLLPFGIQL